MLSTNTNKTLQHRKIRLSNAKRYFFITIFSFTLILPYACAEKKSDSGKVLGLIAIASQSKASSTGTGSTTTTGTTLLGCSDPAKTNITVSTFAGDGSEGSTDATGVAASFYFPQGIAFDSSANIYVSDTGNNKIRKITSSGVVTTFAGQVSNASGSTDATGTSASFNAPNGLAFDTSGNLYVADVSNNKIRKITSSGVVTTFAGQVSNASGSTDATGTAASFNGPNGLAFDTNSNIYIADNFNNKIRKITSSGVVTTIAGLTSNASGSTDGTGTSAGFFRPQGIIFDSNSNIYVAEYSNNKVRKITQAGVVTTFAGLTSNATGSSDGTGTAAGFYYPNALAIDSSGNIYVADSGNNKIRKITSNGVVTSFAGSGVPSYGDGAGTIAKFFGPSGLTVNNNGVIYVTDSYNNRIRKIVCQ